MCDRGCDSAPVAAAYYEDDRMVGSRVVLYC